MRRRGIYTMTAEERRAEWERQRKKERRLVKERASSLRWRHPVKVRVSHLGRKSVIVPHASKYAAILCACDLWGCRFADVSEKIKISERVNE